MRFKLNLMALAIALFTTHFSFAQSDEYELPEDKTTPVITMESTGGFRMRPTEKPEPLISIYPDGTVVAGKTNPQVGRAEWKMKREDLQKLLKFCIKENAMLEMTTQSIKQAIDDSGERIMIADAPNTEIMINIKDKKNKISVYALTFAERQFKDKVKEVIKVSKVAKELKRIHAVTVFGGPEKLDAIIKLANEALKKEDADSPELTGANIVYAQKTKDGTIRMSISHNETAADGRPIANFSVQVVQETGNKPQATVRVFRRK